MDNVDSEKSMLEHQALAWGILDTCNIAGTSQSLVRDTLLFFASHQVSCFEQMVRTSLAKRVGGLDLRTSVAVYNVHHLHFDFLFRNSGGLASASQ